MHQAIVVAERVALVALTALLAFITAGVFVQVVLRYTLAWSFLWGEELSVYGFVWCIFIGSVVNVYRRTNFAFEAIATLLPTRLLPLHRLLVDLIILGCCAIIAWQGWLYASLSIKRMSPALGFSLFIPTLAIPLCFILMALVTLRHLWLDLQDLHAASVSE